MKKLVFTVIAGCIIEMLCCAITSLGDIEEDIPTFGALYIVSFVAYLVVIFFILNNGEVLRNNHLYRKKNTFGNLIQSTTDSRNILWCIVIFSLLFRFTLLPVTPSDDMYRYLWEGKIQSHGVNPYSVPPNSPDLIHLRDTMYAGINHKHLTTIYPPFALMMFAIASFISHTFLSMKLTFLFFDLLTLFLLIRLLQVKGYGPVHVVIYAWNPLVLLSFAGHGHCDSLQIFFLVLAFYLYTVRKDVTFTFALGLAILSKFVSLVFAPFFLLKNKPKYIFILLLILCVFYLPYANTGTGLWSTLFHFGAQYHYNDSLHFLIFCLSLGSPVISKILILGLFCSILMYIYTKYYREQAKGVDVMRYAFWVIGVFLVIAPTVHPWYLTWIVPFLCFYQSKAWLILTGTVVCYYFMNHHLFSTLIEWQNEWVWKEVHWLKLPEYIPFYVLLLYEFINKNLKKYSSA